MIGRLKGILVHEQPQCVKWRVCEAMPRALLNARPRIAGPDYPQLQLLRHGWLPCSLSSGVQL